jgi:hypothetical protein
LVYLAIVAATAAQEYRYEEFSRTGTAALRGLKIGSRIPQLVEGYGNAWCAWATSTLPAEGKPPAKPAKFADPEDEWDYLARLSEWETMYAANRIADGDIKTAWCEGAPVAGTGEAVAVALEPGMLASIFSGYGRDKDVWLKNARPKDVLLTILEIEGSSASQHATLLYNLRAIAQGKRLLEDRFGFQSLDLPAVSMSDGHGHILVIEILSVYPGSKYQDCLISEVRFEPDLGPGGLGPQGEDAIGR